MKMKLAILSLGILFSGSAFSEDAGTVKVPFFHKMIPQGGMTVGYDISGEQPQRISCIFENTYKAFLKIVSGGHEEGTGAFGGNQQVYFTNAGSAFKHTQGLDSLDQYHVDARSHFIVADDFNRSKSYATCFYVPENSK